MAARLTAVTCRAPYLQVVLTSSLGGRINALPADTVADEAALLAGCLEHLLTHLGAVGCFGVYGDRAPADATDPPTGAAANASDQLDELVAQLTPGQRRQVLERLKGKGGSRTEEQTLRYAAAHVLLHDRDGVPLVLERGTPVPAAPVVIDIGGLQERHFHDVRAFFPAGPGSNGPGALILSRHSVPPYTMSRDGDIGLREFLDRKVQGQGDTGLPAAVRHDLHLLWTALPPDQLRSVLDAPMETPR
jgi:hypothetical protein